MAEDQEQAGAGYEQQMAALRHHPLLGNEMRDARADQHDHDGGDGHDHAGHLGAHLASSEVARRGQGRIAERQQGIDGNALHRRLRHHDGADKAEADQRHAGGADLFAEQERGSDQHDKRSDLPERRRIGDLHIG